MNTEQRPAPKPAPHPLEVMAMRFGMYASDQRACIRKGWVTGKRRVLIAETKAETYEDAAKECRAALAELQPDRNAISNVAGRLVAAVRNEEAP